MAGAQGRGSHSPRSGHSVLFPRTTSFTFSTFVAVAAVRNQPWVDPNATGASTLTSTPLARQQWE